MHPKVSIIIPVYNGSNYLSQAIDSALAQDYDNIEIIVVNDGSDDNGETEKIALSYGDKIIYFAKANGKVSSALNYAIDRMKGEYFSWLSHDDLYLSDKISSQMYAIKESGDDMTIVYSGYRLVDKDKNLIETIDFTKMYSKNSLNTYMYPLFRGLLNGCCILLNKKYFDMYGNFNEELWTTQDYDMWFRIMRNANVLYVPEIGVLSRFHDGQDSKTIATFKEECDDLYIKMMKSIDREEMIKMEGSAYLFYKRTAKYLSRSTNFNHAYKYALDLALIEKSDKNISLWRDVLSGETIFLVKDNLYKFKRVKSILHERGIRYLLRKIEVMFNGTSECND